ncbi:hypothetical protein F0P96_10830 [Hymenobacter busanensis]|uniref:Uncharacterized protein n=1 Tax=Hymenobacter busanensis TaxID=2607656 RepID=A0A7L5A0D2_9BACT|nr:hypothetical protein [Hymenobacter busanensis]KAA9333455.1 hypothetical protein F0P96_10830 [Hymenobacter busanensis]QHJ07862.1 hypothetical protein GUY19_11460 [Hymenobacter busanensis]
MLRFTLSLAGAATLLAASAAAQSLPVLDQNRPALRWQQIRTPHFRVIYPEGFAAPAQRTARRLEQVHDAGGASLGVLTHRLPVVLQTQTTVGNAFVTFLPWHAEFFTTPPQQLSVGTVDWLDGLVAHEFRHAAQFSKARQGLGRVLYPLFGDGALGVMSVGMPQWFFEGDAVGNETALTRSGRGRMPDFGAGLRSNLLAGRRYDYQKAACGSFRDQVPNWYELGYFLTSYLKTHYGPAVWDAALDHYYKFPFYPFSFSAGIRHATGLRVEDVYARSMAELDSTWRVQQQGLQLTDAHDFGGQAGTKIFTNYQYPQYLTDSSVLAVKSGLGDIAQFVLLSRNGKQERKVFVPGLVNFPEMLSVAAGKAVWPEFRNHPRWGQQVYSELRILDVASGQLTRLTTRTRYTGAALSPDGLRLVATTTDSAYHHRLVLLDARTGAVQQTLPNPENDFYLQPRWTPDGRQLVAVTLRRGGKTIEVLDPATGVARALLPVANVNLSNPQPWGEYVLYNSPQSGIDNVYAVHTGTGQTYQVTSRAIGAYHAAVAPGGRHLAFHDQRAQGSRVVEMPLEPATWQPVAPPAADAPQPYVQTLAARDPGTKQVGELLPPADSAQTAAAFPATPYSPLRHAFNVFSYGLVQSPAGNGLSVGVRSQDLLNTTQAIAGVSYDQTERTAALFTGVSYQGRFPIFDVDLTHGGRNAGIVYQGQIYRDQWRSTQLTAGLRLPLTLTRSKYLQALSLGVYYLHEEVNGYELPARFLSDVGPNNPLNAVQTTFTYARQLKQSARDVGPRWGESVLLTWRTTPFGQGLDATQLAALGSVYLPGLGKHHSIRLRGGYQRQRQREYQFAAAVSFPRGNGYVSFDRLATASLDYRLPLADTHWSLGRWLYVQRFKAVGFADVAQGRNVDRFVGRYNYRTVGVSGSVVFNFLRLRTPLETGLRATYDTYRKTWQIDPLVLDIGI